MDKKTLISILEDNNHSLGNIQKVIYDYCIEMGKDEKDTDAFIAYISSTLFFLRPCFDTAVNYYKNKFNIVELIDSNNNILKTL